MVPPTSKCYLKLNYTLYHEVNNFINFIMFQEGTWTFIHNSAWTGIEADCGSLMFLTFSVVLLQTFVFVFQIVISDTEDMGPPKTNTDKTTCYR